MIYNLTNCLPFLIFFSSGVYSEVATPVSIPNTAVKHFSGDGTMQKSMGE